MYYLALERNQCIVHKLQYVNNQIALSVLYLYYRYTYLMVRNREAIERMVVQGGMRMDGKEMLRESLILVAITVIEEVLIQQHYNFAIPVVLPY